MPNLIGPTVGVELELNGRTVGVSELLAVDGWCDARQHGYHCGCESCDFRNGLLWRHQRDSTVDGEFITRILSDWATARHAFAVMQAAIDAWNEQGSSGISVDMNTGLHVHIASGRYSWMMISAAYLAFERYIQRIGSGPFVDKRDGMNMTALVALRQQIVAEPGEQVSWRTASEHVRDQISDDRHVDINYSNSNDTIEFRVYNSTIEAWRMELAVRLTVAFCESVRNGYLMNDLDAEFPMPPRSLRTLAPPIDFQQFCTVLALHDRELLPLIERQCGEFPDRDMNAPGPELWTPEPEPEPEPEFSYHCASCRQETEDRLEAFARRRPTELADDEIREMQFLDLDAPPGHYFIRDEDGLFECRSLPTEPEEGWKALPSSDVLILSAYDAVPDGWQIDMRMDPVFYTYTYSLKPYAEPSARTLAASGRRIRPREYLPGIVTAPAGFQWIQLDDPDNSPRRNPDDLF